MDKDILIEQVKANLRRASESLMKARLLITKLDEPDEHEQGIDDSFEQRLDHKAYEAFMSNQEKENVPTE